RLEVNKPGSAAVTEAANSKRSGPPFFHLFRKGDALMQKITTFLWFDNQAEEAANFYASIFKNSKIKKISRYSDAGPGPKGVVMVLTFELEGQQFTALNGGPVFSFTPAISLMVNCETQAEVDE